MIYFENFLAHGTRVSILEEYVQNYDHIVRKIYNHLAYRKIKPEVIKGHLSKLSAGHFCEVKFEAYFQIPFYFLAYKKKKNQEFTKVTITTYLAKDNFSTQTYLIKVSEYEEVYNWCVRAYCEFNNSSCA